MLMVGIVSLAAQSVSHIYVSADAGWSGLLDSRRLASPSFGGGGSVGAGYELRHKAFLLQVGLSGSYACLVSGLRDETFHVAGTDTEGDACTFHFRFTERTNTLQTVSLQVPLLLGGAWNHFYLLAGPELTASLYGSGSAAASVETTATYEGISGTFAGMENHSLGKGIVRSEAKPFSLGLGLRLKAEFGWVFGTQTGRETGFDAPKASSVQYRLGVFASYGLLDRYRPADRGPAVSWHNTADAPGFAFDMNHIYASSAAAEPRVALNDLALGLRFTVLFRLPGRRICVICPY